MCRSRKRKRVARVLSKWEHVRRRRQCRPSHNCDGTSLCSSPANRRGLPQPRSCARRLLRNHYHGRAWTSQSRARIVRDHTDCERRNNLEDVESWPGPHSNTATSGTRKDVSLASMMCQVFLRFMSICMLHELGSATQFTIGFPSWHPPLRSWAHESSSEP
jgi:hypothetical protein